MNRAFRAALSFVLRAHNEAADVRVLGIFGLYVGRALCAARGSPVSILGRPKVDNKPPTQAAPMADPIRAVR